MERQELIDRLNDLTGKVAATIEALADLPDLGGHLYRTTDPGTLRVDIPLTPDAYKVARRKLGRLWKRDGEPWKADDGSVYYRFEHETTGVELMLNFDPLEPGSTCQRVKVGERVEDIYEVVCN